MIPATDHPFDLVVWDFDGVLNANIVDGRFVWAENLQSDLGVDPVAFGDFVFRSGLIREVVAGQTDLLDVVRNWLTAQQHSITADAFLEYWFAQDALPDPEVTGWLQTYPGRSVIGTNNETRRAGYIETRMGYGPLVERVFASGRMNFAKPDAGFFEQIEAWSGADASRVLLIDDSLPNVQAVKERGWHGFHFTPQTRAELPALLGLSC